MLRPGARQNWQHQNDKPSFAKKVERKRVFDKFMKRNIRQRQNIGSITVVDTACLPKSLKGNKEVTRAKFWALRCKEKEEERRREMDDLLMMAKEEETPRAESLKASSVPG